MFHQDHGGKFASGNKRFEVGGEVFANLNSNYTGLFGYQDEYLAAMKYLALHQESDSYREAV